MNVIRNHKTKFIGALMVAVGAIQASSEAVRAVVSPKEFALITIGLGVVVAILGFFNSSYSQDDGKDSGV